MMRIVFMGTPEFAVPVLKVLCESGHEIVGVFTQPDRPKGRGNKTVPSPVKTEAVRQGIPVFQPTRIRKDGIEDLKNLKPDLCVTAAFGQILSQEILDIPPLGNINVHASLLPKHRGSAPIAWAIMQGDKTAGVTTMMMDKGIDTGDMLLNASVEILEGETCGELTARLSEVGAELLKKTLKQLEDGVLKRIPQDESQMTYDPMLKKEMSILKWDRDAVLAAGTINGLNPWPGVTVPFGDGRMKLLRAIVCEGNGIPGSVLTADRKSGLTVACGKGAIRILQVQLPGGKPMRAEDLLLGHPVETGMSFAEETEQDG